MPIERSLCKCQRFDNQSRLIYDGPLICLEQSRTEGGSLWKLDKKGEMMKQLGSQQALENNSIKNHYNFECGLITSNGGNSAPSQAPRRDNFWLLRETIWLHQERLRSNDLKKGEGAAISCLAPARCHSFSFSLALDGSSLPPLVVEG